MATMAQLHRYRTETRQAYERYARGPYTSEAKAEAYQNMRDAIARIDRKIAAMEGNN